MFLSNQFSIVDDTSESGTISTDDVSNSSDYFYSPKPCPSCGHCPTCGRGGWTAPYYPYEPYWIQPIVYGQGYTLPNPQVTYTLM